MIADTVFSIVVEIIFLVQGKVFSLVPIKIIGAALNLLHNCLLHSLYSFEYKWFSQGLELHKRLDYVETNWPYFFGFGLPLAVITSMPESQVFTFTNLHNMNQCFRSWQAASSRYSSHYSLFLGIRP